MKPLILASVILISTSACTFSLGTVQPYPGVTKTQMSFDIAVCSDIAFRKAGSDSRQVGAFLLGATIIGAPIAYEIDKATQRSVFRDCMASLGYRVDAAVEASR